MGGLGRGGECEGGGGEDGGEREEGGGGDGFLLGGWGDESTGGGGGSVSGRAGEGSDAGASVTRPSSTGAMASGEGDGAKSVIEAV